MKPLVATNWKVAGTTAEAVIEGDGQLELQFLSETMARVRYRPSTGYKEPRTWAIAPQTGLDVPWHGRPRDELSGFHPPEVQTNLTSDGPSLSTSRLSVTLQASPLRLVWHSGVGGPLLASDRITSAYLTERRTGAIRHCLQRDPAERYYGLGDKTGPLNLHGRRLRSLAMDSLGYDAKTGDPLYKHWPFVLSRIPGGQWLGLYYDTLASCTFDLGCEHDNYHGFYRYVEIDDGDLDYYFMAGNTPADVIRQFVQLIGGTHLPPRWTLGYAQTAMGLADAPNAQERLDQFIDQIEAHQVPISAFHYGSGYSTRGKRRYVFTWNRDKFPEPKALNHRFHQQGMQVVANIKPCLLDDHPNYNEVAGKQGFIVETRTQLPVKEPFWDGMGSHVDFTHPAGIAWWQQRLKGQVLDWGIDVGWNDNNEYALLDEDAVSHGFGQSIPMHRSRPLHALLMTRATFEAQQERTPDTPVFTVTRAGPPGIQRYAQTWSGDNSTSWHTLRWNIRTGLQMSLSGMFNIGHDVGGFFGPVPSPELLLRWVQACCLNPRMVMNSWKDDGTVNLPWMHPEVTDLVIQAIRLRYTLLPTLWACMEHAHTAHEPILRPTFYNFPTDDHCLEDSDDFMLGANLLVAPVVEPGQRERQVYMPALPKGQLQEWVAFDSGERYAAGQTHTLPAPLHRLPLLVRAGAQLPIAEFASGELPRQDTGRTILRSF